MLNADQPIQCKCGRLRGVLSRIARITRVSCYCRDCQAYARALGKPEAVLDSLGGTEVAATLQQYVTFTQGADMLACLSLSDRGLLRWYASCCNTPIANTARNPKLSYVGLVHSCLGTLALKDADFGSARVVVNTKHAKGDTPATSTLRTLLGIAPIIGSVFRARVNGTWKRSPFFRANFEPIAERRVLTPEERKQAYDAI
jgi:uncharacterized protein DUF6151